MRYPASEKLEIIRIVESRICRCGGHWKSWAFQGPHSTAGTISTGWAVSTPWRITGLAWACVEPGAG